MKRDKELRLALVLYGGVSLAVYMFGVTREIVKLVRASRLYFAEPDAERRDTLPFPEDIAGTDRETDTERVYYDLVRALSRETEIRIVCDVIAGASAGGVTGMYLARALAHDLPLDPLRELWLKNADVLALADDEAKGTRWVKYLLNPFIRRLMTGRFDFGEADAETHEKLSSFMNLRWFKPPFSGRKFTGWMLDAAAEMDGFDAGNSLLPNGHPLELFITLTDFHGHPSRLKLHDPGFIEEREHRCPIAFRYRRSPAGVTDTLGPDNVPGLVFAARATSSFPGAFPPATIAEIDSVLAERGGKWPMRDLFVARNFDTPGNRRRSLDSIPYIDGSVVNNKPFGAAIGALSRRPASREVIRRVVYVDPSPERLGGAGEAGPRVAEPSPGFFRAIFSSLSEIPRNEPIHDDLAIVEEHNQKVRLIASVIDAAAPQVGPMVESILSGGAREAPSATTFARWRDMANTAAAQQSGFAFQSYLRLKTLLVLRRVGSLVAGLAETEIADYTAEEVEQLTGRGGGSAVSDAAIRFLRGFDLDFRVRRLRFVIYRLNSLYRSVGKGGEGRIEGELLDDLKNELHRQLDEARAIWQPENHGDAMRRAARAIIASGGIPDPDGNAAGLAAGLGLDAIDQACDELFSVMVLNYLPEWAREPLIVAYVGFPFFDVLTLPMTQKTDLEELDQVMVDRISPADANSLRKGGAREKLKGVAMHHFGAFFNRRWRENDYLWGRLSAAERLVDILTGAADVQGFDAQPFKYRLFESILAAESRHLAADPDLIGTLRRELAEAQA